MYRWRKLRVGVGCNDTVVNGRRMCVDNLGVVCLSPFCGSHLCVVSCCDGAEHGSFSCGGHSPVWRLSVANFTCYVPRHLTLESF